MTTDSARQAGAGDHLTKVARGSVTRDVISHLRDHAAEIIKHGNYVFAREGSSISEGSLNVHSYVDVRIKAEPLGKHHLLLFRIPVGWSVAKRKIAGGRLPPKPTVVRRNGNVELEPMLIACAGLVEGPKKVVPTGVGLVGPQQIDEVARQVAALSADDIFQLRRIVSEREVSGLWIIGSGDPSYGKASLIERGPKCVYSFGGSVPDVVREWRSLLQFDPYPVKPSVVRATVCGDLERVFSHKGKNPGLHVLDVRVGSGNPSAGATKVISHGEPRTE